MSQGCYLLHVGFEGELLTYSLHLRDVHRLRQSSRASYIDEFGFILILVAGPPFKIRKWKDVTEGVSLTTIISMSKFSLNLACEPHVDCRTLLGR